MKGVNQLRLSYLPKIILCIHKCLYEYISRYLYSHMLQSKQCLLIAFMSGCYVTNRHKWGSFKHTCLLCPLAWGPKV